MGDEGAIEKIREAAEMILEIKEMNIEESRSLKSILLENDRQRMYDLIVRMRVKGK